MLKQVPDLIRARSVIYHKQGNVIRINQDSLINFSHNDYLSLSDHPELKRAFVSGIEKYGVGSGASPLVSGYYQPQKELEDAFSDFLGRDRCLLFNCGYLANIGILSAFQNRYEKVYSDKLCHASILEGIQLSNRKNIRFKHNNLAHLKELLSTATGNPIIITESVFSMEGSITPVKEMADLCPDDSIFIVDDAHGIGVLGEHGRGISELANLEKNDIDCLVAPLGKAFAGMGAIVSGSHDLIEFLLQFAKTYKYSTAMPPAIAYAGLTALRLIQQETWRRHALNDLILYFIKEANNRGLVLSSADLTPIKCIIIGDNQLAMQIKDELLKIGLFVSCIRPPTVPNNTARLRISLNCMHSKQDIISLLDCVAMLCQQ